MGTNNFADAHIVNTHTIISGEQASNLNGINGSRVIEHITPQPVSLVYFTGFYNNESGEVDLKWITASESNNHFFTLEHSPDGLVFSIIGNILGHGTTSAISKYQYTDKDERIKKKSSYYRLSQTDLDGVKKTHEVICINEELKPSKIWVYPTPVQQTKNIHIDFDGLQEGIYTLAILNSSGDRIMEDQVNINYNFQSMEIETFSIPNGLYIIHVFSTADTFIQRIIVQ